MTDGSYAPPGQIGWSGQNWYETSPGTVRTISVIDRPAETYDQYHERRKRAEENGEPRKVPFGFSRVLIDGD